MLDEKIIEVLLDKDEVKKEKSNGRKDHYIVNGIQVQAEVVSKGQEYWEKALAWGKEKSASQRLMLVF